MLFFTLTNCSVDEDSVVEKFLGNYKVIDECGRGGTTIFEISIHPKNETVDSVKQLYDLAENPRPQGCKKLKGRLGYRVRVGDYRIIYEIFDTILVIEVIDLGHRKDIYD